MSNEFENVTLGIGLLLAALLLIVRLVAIKAGLDPIARRYQKGTSAYEAYARLLRPRRYMATLGVAVAAALIIACFLFVNVSRIIHSHEASSVHLLISSVLVALGMFLLLLYIGYRLMVKYYDSTK